MKQGIILAVLGATLSAAWPSAVLAQAPAAPPGQTPAGQPPATGETPAPTERTLSDERTLSRWAYPSSRGKIRSAPATAASTVGRLRFYTEDKLPELYLLLMERTDAQGRMWVKIRVPKRPNGGTGWVPRSALGPYQKVTTFLKVDRQALRVTLYKAGKVVMTARVGVGKRGTITPAGNFWIREKFRVKGVPMYGPFAIGTSAYAPTLSDWPNGGVVGLHGTDQPELIPGRPSHGCIRLRNADIIRLYRKLPVGTPLQIV